MAVLLTNPRETTWAVPFVHLPSHFLSSTSAVKGQEKNYILKQRTQHLKSYGHSKALENHLKILGIPISSNLKWDHYITGCNDSLLKQSKRRMTVIKRTATFTGHMHQFLGQLANGLLNGKTRYSIEVWEGLVRHPYSLIVSMVWEPLWAGGEKFMEWLCKSQ